MQAGWGDDAQDPLDTPLNPHFTREGLEEYSRSTLRNLARIDEDRIDFDLLEELVTYIDQEYGDGAILVFLPGMLPAPPAPPLTTPTSHHQGLLCLTNCVHTQAFML